MQKPIFIIGYMGSGKSRLAKVLSESLSCSHHDLDDLISQAHGKTIEEIFNSEGEIAFRKMEKRQLRLLNESFGVVSMGGGTPCYFDNIDWMNANGVTVYLRAKTPTLVQHLSKENGIVRPLLRDVQKKDLPEFIAKHLFERQYFYEQALISCNVETSGWEEDLVQKITNLN
tara:strand:+ start:903 stop:1418 length:516 start_codon:yes stop_codon:yes gene_type:complete